MRGCFFLNLLSTSSSTAVLHMGQAGVLNSRESTSDRDDVDCESRRAPRLSVLVTVGFSPSVSESKPEASSVGALNAGRWVASGLSGPLGSDARFWRFSGLRAYRSDTGDDWAAAAVAEGLTNPLAGEDVSCLLPPEDPWGALNTFSGLLDFEGRNRSESAPLNLGFALYLTATTVTLRSKGAVFACWLPNGEVSSVLPSFGPSWDRLLDSSAESSPSEACRRLAGLAAVVLAGLFRVGSWVSFSRRTPDFLAETLLPGAVPEEGGDLFGSRESRLLILPLDESPFGLSLSSLLSL